MKKIYFLSFILLFLLSGCSKSYYLVVSNSEVPIYTTETSNEEVIKLSPGKSFLIKGSKAKRYTSFGNYHGYTSYNSSWKSLAKLNKKQAKLLTFTNENGYAYNPKTIADYSGSKNTSSSGSVSVKGYTKKDGTYVKPHTRSAPRHH